MAPATVPPMEQLPRRGTRRRIPKSDPDFINTLALTDEDFAEHEDDIQFGSSTLEGAKAETDDPNWGSDVRTGTDVLSRRAPGRRVPKKHLDVVEQLKSRKPLLKRTRENSKPVATAVARHKEGQSCIWPLMAASKLPPRKRRRMRESKSKQCTIKMPALAAVKC